MTAANSVRLISGIAKMCAPETYIYTHVCMFLKFISQIATNRIKTVCKKSDITEYLNKIIQMILPYRIADHASKFFYKASFIVNIKNVITQYKSKLISFDFN